MSSEVGGVVLEGEEEDVAAIDVVGEEEREELVVGGFVRPDVAVDSRISGGGLPGPAQPGSSNNSPSTMAPDARKGNPGA